jgi:hypothetical protein
MPACIIQQLFRQIVGQDVDPSLVDDVLFPMLLSRKEFVRELSQDIKLVYKIMGEVPFFEADFIVPVFRPEWTPQYHDDIASSKHVRNVRRSRVLRNEWGAIDILNELRELKRPETGGRYRYSGRGLVGDRFADFYINLKEAHWERDSTKEEITEFLEDTLNKDRFLKWRDGVEDGYGLSLDNDSAYYEEY